MVDNSLLLLGTVGWITGMLTVITYYILIVDRITLDDLADDALTHQAGTDGEKVYLPSSMYPHNEFTQVTTLPFTLEQQELLQTVW